LAAYSLFGCGPAALGIFKGEPHPNHASPKHKFNSLQHVTYIGVMYVMYPLLLLSGVALLFPDVVTRGILGYPGVFWVAATNVLKGAKRVFSIESRCPGGTHGM
jgi:hypothetical protein